MADMTIVCFGVRNAENTKMALLYFAITGFHTSCCEDGHSLGAGVSTQKVLRPAGFVAPNVLNICVPVTKLSTRYINVAINAPTTPHVTTIFTTVLMFDLRGFPCRMQMPVETVYRQSLICQVELTIDVTSRHVT